MLDLEKRVLHLEQRVIPLGKTALTRSQLQELSQKALEGATASWDKWYSAEVEKISNATYMRFRCFGWLKWFFAPGRRVYSHEEARVAAEHKISGYAPCMTHWVAREAINNANHWLGPALQNLSLLNVNTTTC